MYYINIYTRITQHENYILYGIHNITLTILYQICNIYFILPMNDLLVQTHYENGKLRLL